MNQPAKANKQPREPQWETLAYDCAALGYDGPESVMRALFRGCYDASNQDIDIARCIMSDMTARQIGDALGFSSEDAAQSAIERLRGRLHVRGRVGVAGIAFRYRFQPWDGKRTTDKPIDYRRGMEHFSRVNFTIEKCIPNFRKLEERYEQDEEERKDLAYNELSIYGHYHLGFVEMLDDATSLEQLQEHLERFDQAADRMIQLDKAQKKAAAEEPESESS